MKASEEDLRRVKANLQTDIAEHARKTGVALPDGRAIEKFITPIIEKIARDPNAKSDGTTEIESPEKSTVLSEEVDVTQLGAYDWNPGTGAFTARPGSYEQTPEDRLRSFTRFLFQHPDWAAELRKTGLMCGKHTTLRKGCAWCERRERRFTDLMKKAAVKFQYGIHKQAAKIIVGGPK